jgi:large subunit ribosomal protein L30
MATKEKKLVIKMVKGYKAADKKQQKVLEALGIRKSQQVVSHDDSPTILGMIRKVSHLVEVKEN